MEIQIAVASDDRTLQSKAALNKAHKEFRAKVDALADPGARINKAIAGSEQLFEMAFFIQSKMKKYNSIKKKLDAAHKKEDVAKFEIAHKEMVKFLLRDFDYAKTASKVKGKRVRLKLTTELKQLMLRQLSQMLNARDGGAHWLKLQKMSPAQRNAAETSRQRMHRHWAE